MDANADRYRDRTSNGHASPDSIRNGDANANRDSDTYTNANCTTNANGYADASAVHTSYAPG